MHIVTDQWAPQGTCDTARAFAVAHRDNQRRVPAGWHSTEWPRPEDPEPEVDGLDQGAVEVVEACWGVLACFERPQIPPPEPAEKLHRSETNLSHNLTGVATAPATRGTPASGPHLL